MSDSKGASAVMPRSDLKSYGGQAVLEGVMMKAPDGAMAVACRLAGGAIVIEELKAAPVAKRYPFLRLPILRGVVSFGESLIGGMEVLQLSAKLASLDEAGEEELSAVQMFLAVVLAVALSVGLFIILPTLLFSLIPLDNIFGGSSILRNLAESCLRLLLFLGYVLIISRMKEIRRVFEYHGAEHKTIHCYEARVELTPQNAAAYSSLHPRCGTSFLLIVMVTSSLFFSLFGWPNLVFRILYRLALLPLVAGISYELLRFMGRFQGSSAFVDALIWPGLQLQRLTTREPDAKELEVAIAALQRVIAMSED